MTRRSIYVACAAVAVWAWPTAGQSPGTYTEPRTGIAFPVSLVPPATESTRHLVGVGVRTKTIFRIKVYAMGLYVDAAGARGALSAHAGVPAEDLERDPDFYQALLDVRLPKTLRLVMARGVTGQDVLEAFDDALRPRLERAARANVLAGATTALEQFRTHFDQAEVSKGTEIVFSCSADGRFETSIGGARRPTIVAPALCWAFFDVYFGESPISRDAKKSLIAGLPGLLAVRPSGSSSGTPRSGASSP